MLIRDHRNRPSDIEIGIFCLILIYIILLVRIVKLPSDKFKYSYSTHLQGESQLDRRS